MTVSRQLSGFPAGHGAPGQKSDKQPLEPSKLTSCGFSRQHRSRLRQHRRRLRNDDTVANAIVARDVQQTIAALGNLARAERLRLLSAEGFDRWLQAQFGDPAYGVVIQALRAP